MVDRSIASLSWWGRAALMGAGLSWCLSCAPPEERGSRRRTEGEIVTEPGVPGGAVGSADSDPVLHPVTRERGEAVVQLGRQEAESPTRAWSGWWYPALSRELFESPEGRAEDSPLGKFDAWSSRRGNPRASAAFERDHVFRAGALPWEGLCDAWAMASLMEPEPTHPILREGIRFSVGDQKALLTKIWERADGKRIYGLPFRGDADSRHEDLLPEEFHRFVQSELFERHRPFIFDKDPGVAIWNTPVWKASFEIDRDEENPETAVRVEAVLLGADPWVERRDAVGTRSMQFQYLYRLDGRWVGANFHVTGGEWLSGDIHGIRIDSRADHPDYVVAIPSAELPHFSRNNELTPDAVAELIGDGGE